MLERTSRYAVYSDGCIHAVDADVAGHAPGAVRLFGLPWGDPGLLPPDAARNCPLCVPNPR